MPATKAHIRATTKFESKAYDRLAIRIRKDREDPSGLSRDKIKAAADAAGTSLNSYVLQAIAEKMKRDKTK